MLIRNTCPLTYLLLLNRLTILLLISERHCESGQNLFIKKITQYCYLAVDCGIAVKAF